MCPDAPGIFICHDLIISKTHNGVTNTPLLCRQSTNPGQLNGCTNLCSVQQGSPTHPVSSPYKHRPKTRFGQFRCHTPYDWLSTSDRRLRFPAKFIFRYPIPPSLYNKFILAGGSYGVDADLTDLFSVYRTSLASLKSGQDSRTGPRPGWRDSYQGLWIHSNITSGSFSTFLLRQSHPLRVLVCSLCAIRHLNWSACIFLKNIL